MRHLVVLTVIFGTMLACGRTKESSPRTEPIAEAVPETKPAAEIPAAAEIPPTAATPIPQKIYDPGTTGPYKVQSYTAGLTNKGYESAAVFYPDDASMASFPATTLSGGYTNSKEIMFWLARHLASHGIIALVFTPTDRMSVDPNIWSVGHLGALDQLELENKRGGSPIAGRVKIDRLGVMGFSMGGAGTVLAVNKAGSRIKAAVPLCPYRPAVLTAAVPMLSITGTRDTVAAPAYVEQAFTASKTGQPKAFAKFNGMTHQDVAIGGAHHADIARFATAWYRVFLLDEAGYQTYLDGEELTKLKADKAVFAQPSDYVYAE